MWQRSSQAAGRYPAGYDGTSPLTWLEMRTCGLHRNAVRHLAQQNDLLTAFYVAEYVCLAPPIGKVVPDCAKAEVADDFVGIATAPRGHITSHDFV